MTNDQLTKVLMTEKTDPYHLHTDSGDINVCTCGGYKPTRREYFTALALQDSPESLKAPEKQERSSVFRALDRG
jgi:hypothetical protein